MEHDLRAWLGSCAMKCDGSVNNGWEVGRREADDFSGSVCDVETFVPVGESEHGVVACGTAV